MPVATVNTLNLALPGQSFYPGQDPYDDREHERKVNWLGGMVARLGADVFGFQEVWHEAALRRVVVDITSRRGSYAATGGELGTHDV